MRGVDEKQGSMLCLISPEQMVPPNHPIRRVKVLADAALKELSPTFEAMYSSIGRPSIPPERLLKASLLMALYTVRSERMFCEQLGYNLLFRWFLDMDMEGDRFDPTVFTKNRKRLLEHDVAGEFFRAVVGQAKRAGLTSSEHFSVDGSLIEAWASLKSFQRKDKNKKDEPPPDDPGNPSVDFHGEKRTNDTHESKTDPEAKLMRKSHGTTAKLSFMAHSLMENRNGLLVDFRITQASGKAEREEALAMLDKLVGTKRITLAADKGYDTREFVDECRERRVTPHVAQNTSNRRSAIDGRTAKQPGYKLSQRIRKRIEEGFGWMKTIGGFRRTRYKGVERTQLAGYFVASAYNLLRMARLIAPRLA